MRHRRTAEQLKQVILKTDDAIRTGKAKTVKEACKKFKIKPSQYYDKRKTIGTDIKMVNNAEQKLTKLKGSFEDALIDRVAEKILERLGRWP